MNAFGGMLTRYNNQEINSNFFSNSIQCHDGQSILYLESGMGVKTIDAKDVFIALVGKCDLFDFAQEAQRKNTLSYELITDKLNSAKGHFAVMLLDKRSGKVSIMSDKFSTQPIYYTHSDSTFSFSTRLKSITRWQPSKPEIDVQAIYQYVYFHCIPSPGTMFKGISKIKPNELISYDNSEVSSKEMFSLQFSSSNQSSAALQEELRETMFQSVAQEIGTTSPNELGAFLSGGLDSSTVVGAYARHLKTEKANSFTIGFDAEGYDETPFARATAKHFGSNHQEYYVTPDDVVDALPKIAAYYDEPFGNSSALPTYFCAKFAKDQGINTLLAGDGGDELFAGNERYAKQKVFERYYQYPKILGREVLGDLIGGVANTTNIGLFNKAKSYIEQARVPLPDRLQTYNFLNHFSYRDIFLSEFSDQVDTSLPEKMLRARYHQPDDADSLNRMLYLDWKFTLADNDLVKVTNMCNLAGVDVRYPMLSDSLVELSMKVPSDTKLPGQQLRQFYKDSFSEFLPESTLNKSKHGFGLPFGNWMVINKNLKDLSGDALSSIQKHHLFDRQFIDKLLNEHTGEHAKYYGELVWVLMMLSLWLDSH